MAVQNRPLFLFVLRRTGRRLTKDRAYVGTGDAAGRPAVAAGTWVSCERLERSVRSVSCSRRFRIFDLDPNFRLAI